ncbi:hypothetical protein CIRG_04749 [Coccidioides immitis RMSCC 2394]|uniref:Uncharacterized protein n=1 Tax=Coccidioides immitis RMSCC 2394 TaxID=404692 RepID=A0A0J6YDS8_COCIT|nr:hypothetical protein CIRG_04749 [Coccidioides immitis RMSCC 2394]
MLPGYNTLSENERFDVSWWSSRMESGAVTPEWYPISLGQNSNCKADVNDKSRSTQASPLALKPSSGSEWTTTQANHFWATLKLLVALNLAHAPCIDDGRVNTVILSHHSER